MDKVKVSIVEDQDEIREGMRFLINQSSEFYCFSAFSNAEDAVRELTLQQPDLVIMDIHLQGMTGIECITQVKSTCPAIQFVMFTIFEDSEQVFDALEAGASGYLLKKTPPDKIIDALKELQAGGAPMSTAIARKVISSFRRQKAAPQANATATHKLSQRENEILELLSRGLFYKEIATQLTISTGTVRQHIHNIYEKLHVQNRTEALNKMYNR